MTYEYKVPHVDFVQEFKENDGADAFFDINEQLEQKLKLSDSEYREGNSEENGPPLKAEKSSTAENVHNKEKRENGVLQEIPGNVQNILERKKRKNDVDIRAVKFISLAESIREFHRHPRETFNSCSRAVGGKATNLASRTHVTIPQSPLLLSKTRTRPVNYPSAEERALKEIEEMESFKIKANPLNRKIFEPPQLGRRISRSPLVVEPFNLTEYKKKEIKPTSPFHFKANPVPKGMLQHPCGIPKKKALPVTSPHTPSFVSKCKIRFQTIEEVDGKLIQIEKSPSHTNVPMGKVCEKTCPCPFSFEERDKLMMKNREEKIKKILQEEREARNFHANPVPTFIKKSIKDASNNSSLISSETSFSNQEKKTVFKARPATVLHKTPFQPKLPERTFTPPSNLMLRTEQRAESRKEYDEYLKQRTEEIEAELLRRRRLQELKEEEEVALLRQNAVLKAQPIRHYKPLPERQKPDVTSPSTPKFSERLKPK